MRIILVRHGKTAGNSERRYVGTTDEPLSEEGRRELVQIPQYRDVQAVWVSPMLRCVQTADILFPDIEKKATEDFRECNFGLFEYKNYSELKDDVFYQKWLDSGGMLPFPQGESRKEFQKRCADAFRIVMQEAQCRKYTQIACVIHGGTIMSILDEFTSDGSYYDFQVQNGDGFIAECNYPDIKGEHMVDFNISICYSIK